MPAQINLLNESSLHNTLKTFYAMNCGGNIEFSDGNYIYDIVEENGNIIEIQTKNLSKLLPKILFTIEKQKKIKLVYPLAITKKIITYDESGKILSTRKSPKKNCILHIFSELTGIYPVLLNEYFSLEVLEVGIIEERKKLSEPVQSKNNRRRFKKDWIKINKRLEEIISTKTFNTKNDYINILPKNLPEEFCAKDLQLAIKNDAYPKNSASLAHIILWVLVRMEIIEYTETKNRNRYYKLTK